MVSEAVEHVGDVDELPAVFGQRLQCVRQRARQKIRVSIRSRDDDGPGVWPTIFFRRPVGAIFGEPLEPSLSWRWISLAVFAPGRSSTRHRGGRGCHRRFRPGAGTSTVPAWEGAPTIQVGEQQHKTCPTAHGFARGTKADPSRPRNGRRGRHHPRHGGHQLVIWDKKVTSRHKSAGKTHPL